MKKILTLVSLFALTVVAVAAQSAATYRDSAAWDAFVSSSYTVSGYDIALTTTNITSTQLGSSNSIPVLAGILGKTRTASTNLSVAFTSLIATNPVASPYTLWARTVASPVGQTNVMISAWTNIAVTWIEQPLPPTNLRILIALP